MLATSILQANVSLASQPLLQQPDKRILPAYMNGYEQDIVKFLEARGLQILSLLGEGAQGSAFTLINIKTTEVSHVLKVIDPRGAGRFHPDEGSHLIAKIQHPGICSPTTFFYLKQKKISMIPEQGALCVATIMPYIKGKELMETKQKIALKAESIFHFGAVLADALHELSVNGIVHGDLHQGNILVTDNLEPILIDFDLCTTRPSFNDTHRMFEHLRDLINMSPGMQAGAKCFLISCLNRTVHKLLNPNTSQYASQLAKPFMQACIDHLSEINPKPYKFLKASHLAHIFMQRCIDYLSKIKSHRISKL